jgi:hypothetical protein
MVDFDPRRAPPPEIASQHDYPPRRNRLGPKPMAPGKWDASGERRVSRFTLVKFFL